MFSEAPPAAIVLTINQYAARADVISRTALQIKNASMEHMENLAQQSLTGDVFPSHS
jgi:hypothetical protein